MVELWRTWESKRGIRIDPAEKSAESIHSKVRVCVCVRVGREGVLFSELSPAEKKKK